MDRHTGHTSPLSEIDECEQVFVERVHAAVTQQTHEVERTSGLPRRLTRVDERGNRKERAIFDAFGNSNEVLLHDAAGAQVEVTHLTVAHLADGQAHRSPRRVQQGVRMSPPEPVPRWCICQGYRVSLAFLAVTKAVDDDEHDLFSVGRHVMKGAGRGRNVARM